MSMLNSFQYYPTGFRIPLGQGVKHETTPDLAVQSIMTLYQSNKVSSELFSFYDPLVQAANRLLPDFVAFLDSQDTNTRISDQAYQFLKDTIQYINTGRRPVAIVSRTSICAGEALAGHYDNPRAAQRRTMLRNELRVPVRDVIFAWLRHKDGIADMLCTLHFLFATDFRK